MENRFSALGYHGPVHVLSQSDCRQLLDEYQEQSYPLIPDWPKGLAASSQTIFRLATLPTILDSVKWVLGNDVMLWGASFVKRMPGQAHAWHNDIESSVPEGRTVSVWIGLENTSRDTALQLISYSHLFKESVQEVRHIANLTRESVSAQEVLEWAKMRNAACTVVSPEMADGDALFFDGWLWHASHNTSNQRRTALLLQYATPDTPIRIPDPNNFEWPFKTLQHPKPPCIMVSGSDHSGVNRLVPPPVTHDGQEKFILSNSIYKMEIPLRPDPGQNWKPFHILRGSTPNLQGITCHVSALSPGHTPHPPHQHKEEEILMLLSGEADLTLPDLAKQGLSVTVPIKPGEFVYYPAWFFHTITARGEVPANYIMLKWYNTKGGTADARLWRSKKAEGQKGRRDILKYGKYAIVDYFMKGESEMKFSTTQVFQQATDCLLTLQCHTSAVMPGGGYAAHTDAHDVAILTLQGEVESLSERVGPMSVLFFPAGQAHDMHNPKDAPAQYVVFEFHGNHPPPVKRKRRTLWRKMQDPRAWRDKWKQLKTRF